MIEDLPVEEQCVDGPQSGRPLGSAPARLQRPGAVPSGHARPLSMPALLQQWLPTHPLSRAAGPQGRKAEDFAMTAEVSDALLRSLWSSLLSSLAQALPPGGPTLGAVLFPQPASGMPAAPDVPQHPQQAVELLSSHHWSLEAAQRDIFERHAAAAARAPSSAAALGKPLGAEYGADRRGTPCGHIFRQKEATYRCRYVLCFAICPANHPTLLPVC